MNEQARKYKSECDRVLLSRLEGGGMVYISEDYFTQEEVYNKLNELRNKTYLDSKDEDAFDLDAALVRGAKFIEVLRKRPPLEISDELSKLDQSMGLY